MRPALRLILDTPLARYDADARDYIQRVERADGQALETGVRQAIDAFVRGCKADGIWNAIKASCILAGARTLSGALVPLKGTAPTNFNFVSGDYNRKTGLVGDGSTKYLNSNVLASTINATSNGLFAYGTISEISGDKSLAGVFNVTLNSIFTLDSWAAYVLGRTFRSGTLEIGRIPVDIRTSSVSCLIGSRTGATSSKLYSDGTVFVSTFSASLSGPALSIPYYALNNGGSIQAPSSSRLQVVGICETGLSDSQAEALRTRMATLVNSIATVVGGDPRYNDVLLLLHGDGANNGTVITDNSPTPRTVTAFGNAVTSTTQSVFGGSSIFFDGNGDYLETPDAAVWDFGSGDFTVEAFVYKTGGSLFTLAAKRPAANPSGWLFSAEDFSAHIGGAWRQSAITAALASNVWTHVAITRSGDIFRLFHAGVVVGTYTQSGALQNVAVPVRVGMVGGTTESPTAGYIDELRITKGFARYTSTFAPPTSPHPDF